MLLFLCQLIKTLADSVLAMDSIGSGSKTWLTNMRISQHHSDMECWL